MFYAGGGTTSTAASHNTALRGPVLQGGQVAALQGGVGAEQGLATILCVLGFAAQGQAVYEQRAQWQRGIGCCWAGKATNAIKKSRQTEEV